MRQFGRPVDGGACAGGRSRETASRESGAIGKEVAPRRSKVLPYGSGSNTGGGYCRALSAGARSSARRILATDRSDSHRHAREGSSSLAAVLLRSLAIAAKGSFDRPRKYAQFSTPGPMPSPRAAGNMARSRGTRRDRRTRRSCPRRSLDRRTQSPWSVGM